MTVRNRNPLFALVAVAGAVLAMPAMAQDPCHGLHEIPWTFLKRPRSAAFQTARRCPWKSDQRPLGKPLSCPYPARRCLDQRGLDTKIDGN